MAARRGHSGRERAAELQKAALLAHLDSVFYGPAWHGASLMKTIQRIPWRSALEENHEGYSAWKIVLHCAYWKFDIRRRITLAGDRPKFPRKPRDFPALPKVTDENGWKEDRRFLEEQHALLREAVNAIPGERLFEMPEGGAYTFEGYILGAASHDVYHTAQIRNLGVKSFN